MDVLISGAGIAGLTLAFFLHRHGHRPVIVKKSPALRDEGYMIDFFGPGYDVSEKMGLLPDLAKIHYQIPRLAFVDPDGRQRLSLDYIRVRKLFGSRHFNFMRGDLERLLYSKIREWVPVRFSTMVESLEDDGTRVCVTFNDRSTGAFDLLVGADGVHSRIRALVFGEEARFSRFLGYYTAAFIVDDPARLPIPGDAFSTMTVPGRQVAVYPIRGGRLATFFVHKAQRVIDDFSRTSMEKELRTVYGDLDSIVPSLLDQSRAVADTHFDSIMQIESPSCGPDRRRLPVRFLDRGSRGVDGDDGRLCPGGGVTDSW